jgi:hypothetical protein
MAETFYAKVLRDFNWPALVREARNVSCGDCGCASEVKHGNTPVHTVLLGSWMNISPSGKYYEPWA